MHPRIFASTHADKPAMIMEETGQTLTYGQLEPIANQGAQFIRSQGIKNGDIIALWATNSIKFIEIYWAAQRAGIYVCLLPTHLSADDAAYIIDNCGAKLLIVSSEIKAAKAFLDTQPSQLKNLKSIFSINGELKHTKPWAEPVSYTHLTLPTKA